MPKIDKNHARIMAHMVACYPDEKRAGIIAEAIVDGGAAYLEVQFPYSDPSADGPVIQHACARALGEGFTKEAGFAFVREYTAKIDIPVFVMSYAGLVFAEGVKSFIEKAHHAGVRGLIIPDLTVDHDEGLYRYGRERNIDIIPVIAPSVTDVRLQRISEERPRFVYAALRTGVTGSRTELGEKERGFIERLKPINARILAGFGIRSRKQVEELQPYVHALIVGSSIVRTIEKYTDNDDTVLRTCVQDKIHHLVTGRGEKKEIIDG